MTCQLCGKPLPKMRLRRDGDFCCREHREQYRLRRGLNCLQEAEELTALRRRRERPAAMALQRPACPPGSAGRRMASGSYPGAAQAPADRFHPPLAILSAVRLPAAGGMAVKSRGRTGVASYARRGAGASRGIAPRLVLTPPGAVPRAAVLQARVPGATGFRAPLRPHACSPGEKRASSWQAARREARVLSRQAAPGTASRMGHNFAPRAPVRALPATAARRGAAVGFTRSSLALPAHKTGAFAVHPPAARFTAACAAGSPCPAARRGPGELARRGPGSPIRFSEMAARMDWSRARCRLMEGGGVKRPPAGEKRTAARRGFGGMTFAVAAPGFASRGRRSPLSAADVRVCARLRAPAPPAPAAPPGRRIVCSGGWTLPAIVRPGARAPRSRAESRIAPVASMKVAPRTGLNAMRPRPAAAGGASPTLPPLYPPHHPAPLAGRGGFSYSAHRRTALAPVRGGAAPRTASVPAPPREPLLGQHPLTLQGTFMGTMEDVRLEENFAAGLSRWVGQIETWRLDAAGVRTGGLALFGPSLGMRDCQLEFLTKVENGGIGWVCRAPDLANYYHVRIRMAGTAAKPAWELVRRAVIAGAAEPPVTAALDVTLRSKASFRVQMTVAGADFSVAVEGREAARWSDPRLAAGGIGFLTEPDDRVRLYWVKVASPAFGVANDE